MSWGIVILKMTLAESAERLHCERDQMVLQNINVGRSIDCLSQDNQVGPASLANATPNVDRSSSVFDRRHMAIFIESLGGAPPYPHSAVNGTELDPGFVRENDLVPLGS